jgi:hypothetical protein
MYAGYSPCLITNFQVLYFVIITQEKCKFEWF